MLVCFTMCQNNRVKKIVPILRILIVVSIFRFTATNECNTRECIWQAKLLRESINRDIDPCENFVQFACGKQFEKFDSMKTIAETELLEPTTYRLHLWEIRRILQEHLSEPENIDDSRELKLAKIFWNSCKNVETDDALKSVRILLKRLGGWPMITKSWNEKHFTWDKFSKCARRLGFLPRMFIFIGLNVDNVQQLWRSNDTIHLTIERPKHVDHSKKEFDSILFDIGYHSIAEYLSENIKPTISEIDAALNFAQQLHELDCAPDERHSETMSIIQLQETFPIIDWFKYIKAMLKPRQAKYLSNYNCIYVDVCYVSAFAKFITRAEKKLQANYAFMAIINDLFNMIRPQLALAFATNREYIVQICFDSTAAIFRKALDVVIGRALDSNLMRKMQEIGNHIHNQTVQLVHTVPWMDEKTKRLARRKLNSITFKNPLSDDIFNNEYFLRLNFKLGDSLPVIFREVNVFLVDKYYLQAGRLKNQYGIYEQDEQKMRAIFQEPIPPYVTTAKADIFRNTIYMPAGVIHHKQLGMQKEMDFVNFASIGVQFGQALTHHIYQKGAHVDAKRKWNIKSWWTKATQEQFALRQSCHTIGPVKPIADASEILGLIGGVEIAYTSMFNHCSTTACGTRFRGLNFNTRQLFWLNLVVSDCDRNLENRYNTLLSHSENFLNDFKCGDDSTMYVTDKCKMWMD